MKLGDLLNNVDIQQYFGSKDVNIEGIAYDSRKIKKNYLFVCIQGLRTDGHNYIADAINNGAKAIIIDKIINGLSELIDEKNITVIKVKQSRSALSKISSNFFGNPSEKIKVIGVTGTNGKTSITYLLSSILEANNNKCALIGTIQNKISGRVYNTNQTTPESLELQGLFSEMVKEKVDICSMEVSSHSLDLKRVEDICFNIGIFTNLTPDHLDYHIDMENYKNAKLKLFYKTSDANIINIDDAYGAEIYSEIKNLNTPVITYGLSKKCDIYAEKIEMHDNFSIFNLVTPKYSGKIRLNIPGLFSIYNILAVISACYSMGYNYDEIVKGISLIKPVQGRFEPVENKKGINVIVDYAHTPDALKNVLSTIKQFAKGKIIVVFGCGGDRDKTKRPLMGKIAYELSDFCIITNDNPRSEDPNSIINDILKGIEAQNGKYEIILDRREAIKTAIKKANRNDVVLIAGKGHETYQVIKDKVFDFDDKKVAMEFLEEDICDRD
ncbi:MAG: UDP-N-acetylmuramoyl-L-alanyl-D-glutamate--2,6-diaminopimelate ligase [Candidatus Petromonas sp.]|nr:UDP-N-acetylmuramoyl-L-alanyl-D-glutamate--2,6-diaminopimelate ligase [Candidatus Petromonas sp.]